MPLSRARLVGELARPVIRTTRWQPLAGAGVAAAVIVYFETKDPCRDAGLPACLGAGTRVLALRLAAVVLAIGAGFLFDDPAEDTLAHVPTPRLLVRGLRLGVALPVAAASWGVCVGVALRAGTGGEPFPIAKMTLEAGALCGLALAASAGARTFVPERLGGVAAGPLVLLSTMVLALLPSRYALFVGEPIEPRWNGAHELWALVLVASLTLAAWWSRDPGARPLRRLILPTMHEARPGPRRGRRPGVPTKPVA